MLLHFEKVGVRHWWKLWFLFYIFVLSCSFMFHMCLQKTHTLFTLRTGWGAIWGVCLGPETRHSASWASAAKLALRPNTKVWGNNEQCCVSSGKWKYFVHPWKYLFKHLSCLSAPQFLHGKGISFNWKWFYLYNYVLFASVSI